MGKVQNMKKLKKGTKTEQEMMMKSEVNEKRLKTCEYIKEEKKMGKVQKMKKWKKKTKIEQETSM